MSKFKILVVDDSVVYRSQIKTALETLSFVESVSVASNGRLAIDRLKVQHFDLVILDLEMPEMDGVSTLRELTRLKIVTKVVVFSSLSKRGAEITMEALKLGASDFVTKPDGSSAGDPKEKILNLLRPKIEALLNYDQPVNSNYEVRKIEKKLSSSEITKPEIILIGSSTGGPTVLEDIFTNLNGELVCPIIIVQHMPAFFTATLAERLSKISGLSVSEAQDGEKVKNQVYIAPGNYHLRVRGSQNDLTLCLDQGEAIHFVRPAVDPLFSSVSKIYKNKVLSFVLTGMGKDGCEGTAEIKKNNGNVVIQDKDTCVVFGMPGSIYEAGHFDLMTTPLEIAKLIKKHAIRESF